MTRFDPPDWSTAVPARLPIEARGMFDTITQAMALGVSTAAIRTFGSEGLSNQDLDTIYQRCRLLGIATGLRSSYFVELVGLPVLGQQESDDADLDPPASSSPGRGSPPLPSPGPAGQATPKEHS